jgi:hypothetical protein
MAKGKNKPAKQAKKPKSDKPKGAGSAYKQNKASEKGLTFAAQAGSTGQSSATAEKTKSHPQGVASRSLFGTSAVLHATRTSRRRRG